ncbi:MAG TPA: hypothetical protein VK886_14420 [Vicinamibacterales bacterium]|nr:hypothetical protein [Vicinamibacterales bacterium]
MTEAQAVSRGRSVRLLLGLAVTPATAVLVALIVYDALCYSGMLSGGAPIDSLDGAASFGMGVGILAVAMTAWAVPLLLYLNERRRLSFRNVLALGAALGNVPFAIVILGIVVAHPIRETLTGDVGRLWYGFSGFVQRVVLGSAVGMSSAAAFWSVAIRGNRDLALSSGDRVIGNGPSHAG